MNFSKIKKPDLSYLHVFGALCYSTNDGEDLELLGNLFQRMFDEYLNPPPCVDCQVPGVIAPEPAISTEADHDIEVAHMDNNPYVDFPIPELSSEESSTQVKLDELGGVLKNKDRLVARRYRQEEGIDFE
ncbi:hypothetical protein Tco_1227582 [Tanacetum coccineum]